MLKLFNFVMLKSIIKKEIAIASYIIYFEIDLLYCAFITLKTLKELKIAMIY